MVYKVFDKKLLTHKKKQELILNKKLKKKKKELAKELCKPIFGKFPKGKVYSSFIGNIWGANLANLQLISKFVKEIRFLFCITYSYSKYAWVIPLKDKYITIGNAF